MRIDRPSSRPEEPGEGDRPSVPERPVQEARPRTSEMLDHNGLNPAEYIREWNKKVESGKADKEQAAAERPGRDVDLRDDNGMTAAELRFLRNKRIDEAEAKASEGAEADMPTRRSVVTDAQGRTGAEIRFQQAQRTEEAKAEAAAEKPEPINDGDDKPEQDRPWRTITDDLGGEPKSWHSFKAAKRELGPVPGTHVHHIVEQSQADPKRSGFSVEQINHSDNMTRIPIEVHQRITAAYNSKPLGADRIQRDMLDGLPWEVQYEIGCRELDRQFRREREHDE